MLLSEVEDELIANEDCYYNEVIEDYDKSRLILANFKIIIKELNLVVRYGIAENKKEFNFLPTFTFYMIFKNDSKQYDYWCQGTITSVLKHYIVYKNIAFNRPVDTLECEVIYD